MFSYAEKLAKPLLKRAFDVRDGEFSRAIQMQLYIFLIISTLMIVKSSVNGLFLSKIGAEHLPEAFVLVALFAAFFSVIYARFLSRIQLNRIIQRTLISSIVILVIFGVLLHIGFLEGWILFLFYIWVAIFAVLSTSQFWILANIIFNSREAKRLFGFIGSGAIAGGIFGGYLTSVLAKAVTSENLLFLSAVLLAFCIPIVKRLWKQNVQGVQSEFVQKKRLKGFGEHPFTLIRHSRHLTYLASIIGISVIVAKLVDYQFSAIASAAIQDPDELTAFFGFWFSNFNVLSLLIQLFLTRRVVGVFGVGSSLFFLPFGIMLGAFVVLFIPELWAAIFLKMSDGSLKQSINKASTELLALPIPTEIKNQTKSFIDVFIDCAATGIGGLILIFVVSGFDLSTRYISLIIMALLIVWAYFAYKVRREYLKSFKLKIEQSKGDDKRKEIDFSNESVVGGITNILEHGSPKQMLFMLRKVRELDDDRFFDVTRKLISHPQPEVRAEALQNLYFYKRYHLVKEIETLVKDPHQQVKIAAFEYLIEHSPDQLVYLMNHYLHDSDYQVSGAALISLAGEIRDNTTMRELFNLENRLKAKIELLPSLNDPIEKEYTMLMILKVVGLADLKEYYSFLEDSFSSTTPAVIKQAILSAGATMNPLFIPTLTGFLSTEGYLGPTRQALSNFGIQILKNFELMAADYSTPIEQLRMIPSVVENLNSQRAVDFLFQLLDHDDQVVRLESLRSLNTLKKSFPQLKFKNREIITFILSEAKMYRNTISVLYAEMHISTSQSGEISAEKREALKEARQSLIVLLEKRLDGFLERIFRLLGLKYPPDDIISIYNSILSENPDIRMNAVEFLDNILEPGLKKVLIPIVETALLDTISEVAVKNLNLRIPDEFHCLKLLLDGKDFRIKLAVLFLITLQQDKKYIPLVQEIVSSRNQKLRTQAIATLSVLEQGT
ncbi:hypothetical protein ACFLS7_06205 [Bacteroidota bacterium]